MAQVLGPNWKQAIESHTEANEKDERYQRMLEENIGTDQVVLNDHDEFVVLKGRPYQPPPSYRPTTRKELLRLLDESFFEWKIKKRGGMPKRNMNSPSFPLSRTDVYEEEYEIDHVKKRQLHKWILQSENRDYHRHLQRVRNRAAGVSKRKAPRNAKLGKARSHWDDTHWSHSAGGREELSSPERELDTLSIYNNSTFDNKEHQRNFELSAKEVNSLFWLKNFRTRENYLRHCAVSAIFGLSLKMLTNIQLFFRKLLLDTQFSCSFLILLFKVFLNFQKWFMFLTPRRMFFVFHLIFTDLRRKETF